MCILGFGDLEIWAFGFGVVCHFWIWESLGSLWGTFEEPWAQNAHNFCVVFIQGPTSIEGGGLPLSLPSLSLTLNFARPPGVCLLHLAQLEPDSDGDSVHHASFNVDRNQMLPCVVMPFN